MVPAQDGERAGAAGIGAGAGAGDGEDLHRMPGNCNYVGFAVPVSGAVRIAWAFESRSYCWRRVVHQPYRIPAKTSGQSRGGKRKNKKRRKKKKEECPKNQEIGQRISRKSGLVGDAATIRRQQHTQISRSTDGWEVCVYSRLIISQDQMAIRRIRYQQVVFV